MKVTIWDLDYYFATDKTNKINSDVQKLSSYYKQRGDQVNFVLNKYDINRPYDIYYIFKEKQETPNPPIDFFMNGKIKWAGEAFKIRKNWKMTDAMLACRPDYLLYPNRNTRIERAERIRLIGNNNNLLPLVQDWTNTFKDKYCIVEDANLWYCPEEVVLQALDKIKDIKNVSFESPIWINKILKCPRIQEKVWELQLSNRSQITWTPVKLDKAEETLNWLVQFKEHFPNCPIKPLRVYCVASKIKEKASENFDTLKKIILLAKKNRILIEIISCKRKQDPFFFLPELVEQWSRTNIKMSWLEFLSAFYRVNKDRISGVTDWNKPSKWPPLFRDALRQTYQDKTFLLRRWGQDSILESEVPWELWNQEFKYGL